MDRNGKMIFFAALFALLIFALAEAKIQGYSSTVAGNVFMGSNQIFLYSVCEDCPEEGSVPTYMFMGIDIASEPDQTELTASATVFIENESGDRVAVEDGTVFVKVLYPDGSSEPVCKIRTAPEGIAYFTYSNDYTKCMDDGCTIRFTFCCANLSQACLVPVCLGEPNIAYQAIPVCKGANANNWPANAIVGGKYVPLYPSIDEVSIPKLQINLFTIFAYEACLPLLAIFGLLSAAMFVSGRNPFAMFSLYTPRFKRSGERAIRAKGYTLDINAIGSRIAQAAMTGHSIKKGDASLGTTQAKGDKGFFGNIKQAGQAVKADFGRMSRVPTAATASPTKGPQQQVAGSKVTQTDADKTGKMDRVLQTAGGQVALSIGMILWTILRALLGKICGGNYMLSIFVSGGMGFKGLLSRVDDLVAQKGLVPALAFLKQQYSEIENLKAVEVSKGVWILTAVDEKGNPIGQPYGGQVFGSKEKAEGFQKTELAILGSQIKNLADRNSDVLNRLETKKILAEADEALKNWAKERGITLTPENKKKLLDAMLKDESFAKNLEGFKNIDQINKAANAVDKVEDAKERLKEAKANLEKAEASGNKQEIENAKKELEAAREEVRTANANLAKAAGVEASESKVDTLKEDLKAAQKSGDKDAVSALKKDLAEAQEELKQAEKNLAAAKNLGKLQHDFAQHQAEVAGLENNLREKGATPEQMAENEQLNKAKGDLAAAREEVSKATPVVTEKMAEAATLARTGLLLGNGDQDLLKSDAGRLAVGYLEKQLNDKTASNTDLLAAAIILAQYDKNGELSKEGGALEGLNKAAYYFQANGAAAAQRAANLEYIEAVGSAEEIKKAKERELDDAKDALAILAARAHTLETSSGNNSQEERQKLSHEIADAQRLTLAQEQDRNKVDSQIEALRDYMGGLGEEKPTARGIAIAMGISEAQANKLMPEIQDHFSGMSSQGRVSGFYGSMYQSSVDNLRGVTTEGVGAGISGMNDLNTILVRADAGRKEAVAAGQVFENDLMAASAYMVGRQADLGEYIQSHSAMLDKVNKDLEAAKTPEEEKKLEDQKKQLELQLEHARAEAAENNRFLMETADFAAGTRVDMRHGDTILSSDEATSKKTLYALIDPNNSSELTPEEREKAKKELRDIVVATQLGSAVGVNGEAISNAESRFQALEAEHGPPLPKGEAAVASELTSQQKVDQDMGTFYGNYGELKAEAQQQVDKTVSAIDAGNAASRIEAVQKLNEGVEGHYGTDASHFVQIEVSGKPVVLDLSNEADKQLMRDYRANLMLEVSQSEISQTARTEALHEERTAISQEEAGIRYEVSRMTALRGEEKELNNIIQQATEAGDSEKLKKATEALERVHSTMDEVVSGREFRSVQEKLEEKQAESNREVQVDLYAQRLSQEQYDREKAVLDWYKEHPQENLDMGALNKQSQAEWEQIHRDVDEYRETLKKKGEETEKQREENERAQDIERMNSFAFNQAASEKYYAAKEHAGEAPAPPGPTIEEQATLERIRMAPSFEAGEPSGTPLTGEPGEAHNRAIENMLRQPYVESAPLVDIGAPKPEEKPTEAPKAPEAPEAPPAPPHEKIDTDNYIRGAGKPAWDMTPTELDNYISATKPGLPEVPTGGEKTDVHTDVIDEWKNRAPLQAPPSMKLDEPELKPPKRRAGLKPLDTGKMDIEEE